MKKTLFLSAILGAALCSSAFATTTWNGQAHGGYNAVTGADGSKSSVYVLYTRDQNNLTLTTDEKNFDISPDKTNGPATAVVTSMTSSAAGANFYISPNAWGYDRSFASLTIEEATLNAARLHVYNSNEGGTINATLKKVVGSLGGVTNTGDLTLGTEDSNIAVSGIITNSGSGTLTLNGEYTFDATPLSHYETISATKVASSGNGYVSYESGSTFYVVKGATSATNATFSTSDGTNTITQEGSTGNYILTLQQTTESDIYSINNQSADAIIDKRDAILEAGTHATSGKVEIGKRNQADAALTLTLEGTTSLRAGDYIEVFEGSSINLKGTSSVTVTNNNDANALWMQNGSTITIASGATLSVTGALTLKGGSISATGSTQIGGNSKWADATKASIRDSIITITGTNLREYNISGGSVTVTQNNTTINSALSSSTALTLNDNVTATMKKAGAVGELTMKSNSTLVATKNMTIGSMANMDNKGTVGIRFADNATLTMSNSRIWLNTTTLSLRNTIVDDVTTGGMLVAKGFLSGFGNNSTTYGNLSIDEKVTLKITGTAATNSTDNGFIIWNGAPHTYTINGALVIENGIRAQGYSGSSESSSETFNIGSNGLLQLNKGITFVTQTGADKAPVDKMGTINVNGGTLAIGGQTSGSKAKIVNLNDKAKVVAIDANTSTEQVFTLHDYHTVTFSGKGLDGTADNTLTVNSAINNSTAAVDSVGNVNFSDMTTVRLTVDGSTTVRTLTTDAVIMKDAASLTAAGADTNIASLTLGAGSSITLGSAGNHNFDLTTSTLTVSGDSTMNANLVVANNGKLDFSSGAILTMGCDVTINGNDVTVVIDHNELASIQQGKELTLITNINQLTLNEDITVHFKGENNQSLDGFGLRLEQGKDGISLVVTPEPATATLSLLALAALASRRKRH